MDKKKTTVSARKTDTECPQSDLSDLRVASDVNVRTFTRPGYRRSDLLGRPRPHSRRSLQATYVALLGRLASSLLIQLLAFAAAVGGTAMLFVAIVDGTDGLTLGTVGVVVSLLGMTAMVYLPDTDEGGRQ